MRESLQLSMSLLLVSSALSSASAQTILGRARDKASGALLGHIEVQLVRDTGSLHARRREHVDSGRSRST
jgi:hypothetical protein